MASRLTLNLFGKGDTIMSSTRNSEEMQNVTLLGNQDTKYKYDYDPQNIRSF